MAHCPRSHLYFDHAPFPLRRLLKAGVNVCLATDSLASVYQPRGETLELNLFEEMRAVSEAHPWLRPRTILRMATVSGARALGMAGKAGQLSQGGFADLIALPFAGSERGVFDRILEHRGPVAASLIGGVWAIPAAAQ